MTQQDRERVDGRKIDGWAPRGIRVVLGPDEAIRHCAHCDRYDDDDPFAHPSCLIVKQTDLAAHGPDAAGVGGEDV